MPPLLVNLMALLSRLVIIWFNRFLSDLTSFEKVWIVIEKDKFFHPICI